MSMPVPAAAKLGKLIRLLSSDKDGEVLAAVGAIKRTLQSEGINIHSLAAVIESGAQQIHVEPSWYEIACECENNFEKLREREREFVQDMVRRTVHGGEPTEKQAAWHRAIYVRVRK
jgi:hypothetical protein